MTLIVAGYWQTTYWAENYFMQDYWPEYGVEAPPAPPPSDIIGGGVTQTKPQFPLTLGLTLDGKLEWVIPIKLKKEN